MPYSLDDYQAELPIGVSYGELSTLGRGMLHAKMVANDRAEQFRQEKQALREEIWKAHPHLRKIALVEFLERIRESQEEACVDVVEVLEEELKTLE